MPQTNATVAEFDLMSDMSAYYRGAVLTYSDPTTGQVPAYVHGFDGTNEELRACIQPLYQKSKDWETQRWVPVETLDFTLPPLGLVEIDKNWFHLSRSPARRMRKGYHEETIQWSFLEGTSRHPDVQVTHTAVVKQLWFGNESRITPNIVVWNKGIYYMTDKVATVDDNGQVELIPNKEKLGEFVCKALANNWEKATSKHSVRTLPSSLQTPLA